MAGLNALQFWSNRLKKAIHITATAIKKQTQKLNPGEGKGARTYIDIFTLQLLRLSR